MSEDTTGQPTDTTNARSELARLVSKSGRNIGSWGQLDGWQHTAKNKEDTK